MREWLAQIYLSALTYEAMRSRVGLADADARIREGRASISLQDVLGLLFQSQIVEEQENTGAPCFSTSSDRNWTSASEIRPYSKSCTVSAPRFGNRSGPIGSHGFKGCIPLHPSGGVASFGNRPLPRDRPRGPVGRLGPWSGARRASGGLTPGCG